MRSAIILVAIFVHGLCPARDAFLIDVRDAGFEETLMYTSLQGLANRKSPKVFLVFNDSDSIWVNHYEKIYRYDFQQCDDPLPLIRRLKVHFKGYVVWDPLSIHSANVATILSGLYDLLVLSPEYQNMAEKAGLRKKFDLTGKFEGWTSHEVYRWAAKRFLSRCNRDVIGALGLPNEVQFSLSDLPPKDKTIIWRFEDAQQADGNGAKLRQIFAVSATETLHVRPGTAFEREFLVDSNGSWVDADGDRIADRRQHFSYRFHFSQNDTWVKMKVFVENQYRVTALVDGDKRIAVSSADLSKPIFNQIRDYLVAERAFVCDLSADPDDHESRETKSEIFGKMRPGGIVFGWTRRGESESELVSLASQKGLTVLCSQNAPNFSFHSRVKASVPRIAKERTEPRAEEGKVYVAFIASDGDALHRLSNFQRGEWLSPDRGQIPLGWEMQPLLKDLAPAMVNYYVKSASRNDDFVASASGFGYFYPSLMPEAELRAILVRAKHYIASLRFPSLMVLSCQHLHNELVDLYYSVLGDELLGCFEGYWRREGETKYLPGFSWLPTSLPPTWMSKPADLLSGLRLVGGTTQLGGPRFVVVHFDFCRLSYKQILDIVSRLDARLFRIVTPQALLRLTQEYHRNRKIVMPDSPTVIEGIPTYIPLRFNNNTDHNETVRVTGNVRALRPIHAVVRPGESVEDSLLVTGVAARVRIEVESSDGRASSRLHLDRLKSGTSGLRRATFLQVFEAELLSHCFGEFTVDAEALNGFAWRSTEKSRKACHLVYGPRERREAGDYLAFFRIKLATAEAPSLLKIQVSDMSGRDTNMIEILASRQIGPGELTPGKYCDFPIEFHHTGRGSLEYRVLYGGGGSVVVDRITLFEI